MPTFMPVIAPEVFALRPDFRALSIHATGIRNSSSHEHASARLMEACALPCNEPWAEAHREAWREAYRAFGAKPQRTPCSAEALLKRVQRDGSIPGINAVVDLYNAISLRYAIPVGGENAAAYEGAPRLLRAAGTEVFDTIQAGVPAMEHPETGEVVWCDDRGVTCRRWNWRQGARTRIEEDTADMWFILEALEPMPDQALNDALEEFLGNLKTIDPSCHLQTTLLSKEGAAPFM